MPPSRIKSFEALAHQEQDRRLQAASRQMAASSLQAGPNGGKLRVDAEVAPHADPSAVNECRDVVLDWMQEKADGRLPRKALRHRSFSHRGGEEGCRAVRVRDVRGDYWAAQLERSPGAGQAMVTEVVVAHPEGRSPTVGIEVVDRSVVPAELVSEYPAEMLATMAARVPLLHDGRRLSHEPIVVESAETMAGFQQMLLDPGRKIPLAVLSKPPEPEHPDELRAQWESLARALTGLAIVWVLPPAMTYRLSDLVTKNLSVFLGAWRFYRPGFGFGAQWSDHPLFLKNRMEDERGLAEVTRQILRMAAEERLRAGSGTDNVLGYDRLARDAASFARGPARLFEFLRNSIWGGPAAAPRPEYGAPADSATTTAPPTPAVVREPAAALAPNPAAVPDETPLLRRKLTAARDKARARASRYERAKQRADAAERERDEARKRADQLAGLVRSLGGNPDAETPFPTAWDEFTPWCDESLAGRVTLAGSARREVGSAEFEDVGLAASCLNWLALVYRDGRLRGGDPALHGSIDEIADGVHNLPCGGDSFDYAWEGRRHRVDWHIKRGANTRDPRRCLRIYYFWDEGARQVVVVSMPAHRRSTST